MASPHMNGSLSASSETVTIAEVPDLILRVVDCDDEFVGPEKPARVTVDFEINRATVSKMAFSPVLAKMLDPDAKWLESKQTTVEIKAQDPVAIAPFLREVHEKHDHSYDEVDIEMIWKVLWTAHRFQFKLDPLESWFATWVNLKEMETWKSSTVAKKTQISRQVLYPAYVFDHASLFNRATRWLVYNGTGHLMEDSPLKKGELHLPKLVIQQLNAAKGRIRTILHNGLFGAISPCLSATCNGKEQTFFRYFKKMSDIEVFPFETTFKDTSIDTMIDRLDDFTWARSDSECSKCKHCYGLCNQDFEVKVESAARNAGGYFGGLCLDCMDDQKAKTGDKHSDYWNHGKLKVWGQNCRVKHGQPTWYFSFMGRKEDQSKMMEEIRARHGRN